MTDRLGPTPPPISQFGIIFKTGQFQHVVSCRMLNREALEVLVHRLTRSSHYDRNRNALWLGTPVPSKLDTLRSTCRPELYPKA